MDVQIQELERIVKMLVRRDFELSQTRAEQEEQIHELDRIAKMLVRRDLELLQTNEMMRRLDEAKAKDEALLASIGEGIVATDREGRTTTVNQSAETMLGFSAQDVLGQEWSSRVRLEDDDGNIVPHEERPITLALTSGKKIIEDTCAYFRKDGTRFSAAIIASPVLLDDRVVGAVEVFHDITKGREIDRAKSEFVSLASHQLRTPLSAMKWQLETVLAERFGNISGKEKEYLEKIYSANERMIGLVNALLDVSRIELGTLAIEPEPVNLEEVAESVLDELSSSIQSKALIVEKHYDQDLPVAHVDPRLIRIVLQNLLSNAVKYTPHGGRVRLTLKKQESDALIEVEDTGCGIPQAQQEKIFTKLFRADNVREKDADGTGLGLYIVKSVVEQSGGKIWFASEENKGTQFSVTIPLKGTKKEGARGLL